MKKIFVLLLLVVGLFAFGGCGKVLDTSSYGKEEVEEMLSKVYSDVEVDLPFLESTYLDITDSNMLKFYTGLTDSSNISFILASMPPNTSQPYSFYLIKLNKGADMGKVKKDIFDNIDMRRWICVWADRLYVTNYGDSVVMVIMSSEEWADSVYKSLDKNYELGETLKK